MTGTGFSFVSAQRRRPLPVLVPVAGRRLAPVRFGFLVSVGKGFAGLNAGGRGFESLNKSACAKGRNVRAGG